MPEKVKFSSLSGRYLSRLLSISTSIVSSAVGQPVSWLAFSHLDMTHVTRAVSAKFFNLVLASRIQQGKLETQWLNVVPCKNLGLKLDDQQLQISIGLRLGAKIWVAHTCHCGKRVERDGLHGLSCTKSAGRFSRHATLSSLIKQTLEPLDLPSVLEPRGRYGTKGKRPDGPTMIPWEVG